MIDNVTNKMFFLLNALDERDKEQRVLHELKSPFPKYNNEFVMNQPPATPRMSITDYSKSPFIKKKLSTKVKLMFNDFERAIDKDEFDKISEYMRKRITVVDLQEFLDNAIIKCFNEKYEILYKQRSCLKPSDFSLQSTYKDQMQLFDDYKFISIQDLVRTLNKPLDKKHEQFIQCLRHLQIIKEMRKSKMTYYVWISK
jgi:hypothetical protein